MRENLQGVEKKKEKREETRRGREIGIEIEIGIETGTERGGEAKRGTETRIGKGTETETMIDIAEIAIGIEVREGNVGERGMMTMMIITAAETMRGNIYR